MMELKTELRNVQSVGAELLRSLTGRGWVLIATYQEPGEEKVYLEHQCKGGRTGAPCLHGITYAHHHGEYVKNKVLKTFFLVGQSTDDAMSDLAERLQRAESAAAASHEKARAAGNDLAAAEKKVHELTDMLENLEDSEKRAEERRRAAADQLRRGESALAEEREKVKKLTDELAKRVTA